MSQDLIISLAVNLGAIVLPLIGIHLGSEQLTETMQTLIGVVTGLIIYFEHKKATDIIASHGL